MTSKTVPWGSETDCLCPNVLLFMSRTHQITELKALVELFILFDNVSLYQCEFLSQVSHRAFWVLSLNSFVLFIVCCLVLIQYT